MVVTETASVDMTQGVQRSPQPSVKDSAAAAYSSEKHTDVLENSLPKKKRY